MRLASSLLFLFAFWLLLSGHYVPFLIAAGLTCALLVVLFARRMDLVDHEGPCST